jgi:hypothetical protein
MNFKKLVRHFPELARFPAEEQYRLLTTAYQDVFSPGNKQRNWRGNLIAALIITSSSFLLILLLRPSLGISQPTSAILLVAITFPAYLIFQQQRTIKQIRVSLQKLLP